MSDKKETIFALSSATGKSAVALIRITGKNSYNIIDSISSSMPKKANTASFNKIMSDDGTIIDQTITTYFKGPKSFTGEDMVEIAIHGGGAVIKKMYKILVSKNMQIAKPGEFTRRAFANNKLDLTQVEAIADIVNSETEMQRKQAISHLSGDFFNSSRALFERLKKILANIEAVIDFTEEDLPENLMNSIKEQIENGINDIAIMLKNSSSGVSIRDGFLITILGKPNTGKSSFINCISKKEVAIVTDEPGTTRDLIESFIDVGGYPIKFIDTAGIREASNLVEKIGIEKAYTASKEADINIVFVENKEDILGFKSIGNSIFVRSKQDISKLPFLEDGLYNISSSSFFGIKDLLSIIIDKIQKNTPKESMFISRERHIQCLSETLRYLKESQESKNIDMFAEDIRLSLKNLSSLFGNVDIEDILDIIFSDFCIGK